MPELLGIPIKENANLHKGTLVIANREGAVLAMIVNIGEPAKQTIEHKEDGEV